MGDTSISGNKYSIFSDAQSFVDQWDHDEWDLDKEKVKSIPFIIDNKTVSAADRLPELMTRFRQVTSAAILWQNHGKDTATFEIHMMNLKNMTEASVDLVNFRDQLKGHHILVPGPAYKKKMAQLEEQLEHERKEKSEIASKLESVTTAYERLKNRIIGEMGKAGEEYVREAITESDATIWSSIVTEEESNEDDNK